MELPKFDAYVLPLGTPTQFSPLTYAKSLPVEGQVSRYAYIAPAGRTATELLRNYKLEFQRLGLEEYEKKAGEHGWFGPTFDNIAEEDGLSQILAYNEADQRMLVSKSRDRTPTYYLVFVTSYKDGVIPERLAGVVQKGPCRFAEVIVISPDVMEQKMTFVNADEMKKQIAETGKVALYGIYFDTDKDVLKPESESTIAEIVKFLKSDGSMRIHVVGHTDNQGAIDHNLDLSKRRAGSVVHALTSQGIPASRLDSFGCGVYAPVASNDTEEGRAKNRRVELTRW